MEITTYNLHGGSFRPSLGLLQNQAYSALVRSRRCYEITQALAGGGSAFPWVAHNCLPLAIVGFEGLHLPVPRGLDRFHHSRAAHFITFTCYHRYPHLADPIVRDLFVRALERTRTLYRLHVYAFVVMPETCALLLSEPERGTLANAIQSLPSKRGKQLKAVRDVVAPFWQTRNYDRNKSDHKEFIEKLKYIHRNRRGPRQAPFLRLLG
jgi:putative transposase